MLTSRDYTVLAIGAVAVAGAGVAAYYYWQASQPPEVTLAMIKPDAVAAGAAEEIEAAAQQAGFYVVSKKQYTLTKDQAKEFYAEHKERPFYGKLVDFMSSGPLVALALRKRKAITAWRSLCGPTSTETAKEKAPKSLRAKFGTDNTKNAVHGSDSPESAARELAFHFGELQVQPH